MRPTCQKHMRLKSGKKNLATRFFEQGQWGVVLGPDVHEHPVRRPRNHEQFRECP